jgi:hypothetical protein
MKDAAEVVTPEPDSPQYRRLKQSISDGQALLAEARPSASDLAGFSESSDETWKKG